MQRMLKAKAEARGLRFSSSHVSLAALQERPDQVIAASRLLGIEQLFMPAVPPAQRDVDASGWRALGRELGGLATRFAGEGIQLGYHNHNWELKPKDGTKTALDLLFAEARRQPADVGRRTWPGWYRGGAAPDVLLQRYRDRVVSVHVKDIAPASTKLDEDGWADVGAGVLDWRTLWQICRDCGALWMVVEHDKPCGSGTLRPRELRLAVETARLNGMEATTIGIIGCGNISAAYLGGAARSRLVRVKSVADIRAEAAKTKAAELLAAGYVCGYSACRSGN